MHPGGERKKPRDSSHFRRELKTFWPRSHPVVFPHLQTDHWSKMKTTVPDYLSSIPAALLKDSENKKLFPDVNNTVSLWPPLPETASCHRATSTKRVYRTPKSMILPQNMPQYRNVFNDRARRNFCYWLVEKKSPTCEGRSMGAYKTSLGIPKM
ncbi:uncharacterized protein V3H82_005954 [Fundulus diaphanus]